MAETFTYDVFISHSAKDKPAVRERAERLRKDGLHVWLDNWRSGRTIPSRPRSNKAWSNRGRSCG